MRRTRWVRIDGQARLLAVALGLMVFLGAGCTVWRPQRLSPQGLIATKQPSELRVTIVRQGMLWETLEIGAPRIEGDSLVGTLLNRGWHELYTERAARRAAVALSDVGMLEVREVSAGRTAAGLAVGVGVTALMVAVAAVTSDDRKTPPPSTAPPMVSCPHIESWDGTGWQIDSGTFGGAIAPALRRTDVDNLDRVTVTGGKVRLRMSDVADETEHVDQVRLVKVPLAPGLTVSPNSEGDLFSLGPIVPPASARDIGGKDVVETLRALDGRTWESNPAVWDTTAAGRIRDGVEMTFLRPAGARRGKLVIDGSNTPWSAALMVDLVAAHGRTTPDWYRSLEDTATRAGTERLLAESYLSVAVRTKQGWQMQGVVREAGPEVRKRQVHLLDLSNVEGDTLRLRLEAIPSFWLLDQVGIDYTDEVGFETVELPLVSATDGQGRNVRSLLAADDSLEYVMETGDAAELVFADDPRVPGPCSYLLFTTGWYRIHTPQSGEPQTAMLRRLGSDPASVSRMAVAKLHEAVGRLEASSR